MRTYPGPPLASLSSQHCWVLWQAHPPPKVAAAGVPGINTPGVEERESGYRSTSRIIAFSTNASSCLENRVRKRRFCSYSFHTHTHTQPEHTTSVPVSRNQTSRKERETRRLLPSSTAMGCESSQPVVANAAKNEVDLQLERLHEEERTHYKVGLVGYEASTTAAGRARASISCVPAIKPAGKGRCFLLLALVAPPTPKPNGSRDVGVCVSRSLSPADLLG